MVAGRIPPGNKASVALENNVGVCYCWSSSDGIVATAICDNDYPEKAAFILLNKMIMEFREVFTQEQLDATSADTKVVFPQIETFMKEWQDPTEADKLLKVEKELVEVKSIVHSNLQDLLRRGEDMDQLMAKSKDLTTVSVDFYKKAKKQNSGCCSMN